MCLLVNKFAAQRVLNPLRFDQSRRLVCSTTRGLKHAADRVGTPDCVQHLEFTRSCLDVCYTTPSRFASFFKVLDLGQKATSLVVDCKPRVDFFDDRIPTRLWIREKLFHHLENMPDLAMLSLPFRDPDSLMDMANDTEKDWTLWQVRYFCIVAREFDIPLNRYLLAVMMLCPNLTHVSYTIQRGDSILKILKNLILPSALQTFILFVPFTRTLSPSDKTSKNSLQEELREWVGDYRIVLLRVHTTMFKEIYRDNPNRLAFQRGLLSLSNCAGSSLNGQYPEAGQDEVWAVADDIVRRRQGKKAIWEEGACIQYLEDVDMAL